MHRLKEMEHKALFGLLVLINFFVGGMVGLERTVLPLIAESEFQLSSAIAGVSFIVSFGLTKAIMNFFAGKLSDVFGRKHILVFGWVLAIPIPFLLIYADSWSVILFANVLLGIQQSLTWSMTVVMKVDLVQPDQRGLAIGLNEFAGYFGLSVIAYFTGVIASEFTSRPEPFYLGFVLIFLGLLLSLFTKETKHHAHKSSEVISLKTVFFLTSWHNKSLRLSSLSGLLTNFKDGMLWGLLPILLTQYKLTLIEISWVVAIYPIFWSVSQLKFGPLSDKVGRKRLILSGLIVQAFGMIMFALFSEFYLLLISAICTGIGTGMVYPTLIAFVSDHSEAHYRATSLGIYRFWRDLGYAVGALSAGVLSVYLGTPMTFLITSVLLICTATLGFRVMREKQLFS